MNSIKLTSDGQVLSFEFRDSEEKPWSEAQDAKLSQYCKHNLADVCSKILDRIGTIYSSAETVKLIFEGPKEEFVLLCETVHKMNLSCILPINGNMINLLEALQSQKHYLRIKRETREEELKNQIRKYCNDFIYEDMREYGNNLANHLKESFFPEQVFIRIEQEWEATGKEKEIAAFDELQKRIDRYYDSIFQEIVKSATVFSESFWKQKTCKNARDFVEFVRHTLKCGSAVGQIEQNCFEIKVLNIKKKEYVCYNPYRNHMFVLKAAPFDSLKCTRGLSDAMGESVANLYMELVRKCKKGLIWWTDNLLRIVFDKYFCLSPLLIDLDEEIQNIEKKIAELNEAINCMVN